MDSAAVGGNPSAVERALIERAIWQTLRVAQYDAMVVAGDTLSEDENRTHLAWVNSLSRTLDRTQVIPFVIRQNDDCACERPPLFESFAGYYFAVLATHPAVF